MISAERWILELGLLDLRLHLRRQAHQDIRSDVVAHRRNAAGPYEEDDYAQGEAYDSETEGDSRCLLCVFCDSQFHECAIKEWSLGKRFGWLDSVHIPVPKGQARLFVELYLGHDSFIVEGTGCIVYGKTVLNYPGA